MDANMTLSSASHDRLGSLSGRFLGSSRASLLVVLALAGLLVPGTARSAVQAPPWRWVKGSIGASILTEYFTTNSNHDDKRGSFTRLLNDNSVDTWETDFRVRYGLKDWVSPYAGFGFANTRVVEPAVIKTNTNFGYVHAGADFRIVTGWKLRIFPQIEVGWPIEPTRQNQTTPLTSDGTPWARASIFLQLPMRYLGVYVHGGVRVPGEGLAKLLLYGAGAEVPLGDRLVIGGGLEGHETLIGDDLSQVERESTTTTAMAGSHRYWAYDPALLEGRLWARFRPDPRIWLRAGYAKTIDGVRSARGQSFTAALIFNVPWERLSGWPLSSGDDKKVRMAPSSGQKFEIETEKVDQDLFQPNEQIDDSRPLDDTESLLDKK